MFLKLSVRSLLLDVIEVTPASGWIYFLTSRGKEFDLRQSAEGGRLRPP